MKFVIDASGLNGLADDIEEFATQEARKIATDMYADLVLNTPVDTGALRNAWELDTNAANPSVSNTMPYANRVMEMGHSKQAPAGTLSSIIDKYTD